MFNIRHWDLLQLLFVAAACFAIAAVGFFLAVFLQLRWGETALQNPVTLVVPVEDKLKVVGDSGSGAQTKNIPGDANNSADQEDPRAAEKLKIIESRSSS